MEHGSTIEDDTLKIGDYITIKNLRLNSFLCAEGILFEDIIVNDTIDSFEDALFCIHLQRQYSASSELETFAQTYKIDVSATIEDPNTAKYLHALQRGRDNEAKLNESYMKQKTGTTVLFGDVIQLLHVKSGKFVTVIPDQLARDERENIRICLTAEGNAHSWLQIIPRYKIDREGDRILSNTEVVLKVAERPNEFIHCSEKDPPAEYSHEVNCSLENSSWKLSLYQNVRDTLESMHLLCSQLVIIHDPETLSNLTVCNKDKNKIPKRDVSSDIEKVDLGHVEDTGPSDYGKVTGQPATEGDGQDTNSVWVVESRSREVGGRVQWKTEMVRFRNLNTGRYLVMENGSVAAENAEVSVKLGTTATMEDPATLFSVQEVYGSSSYLSMAKAVQINFNGLWLARGAYEEATEGYYCIGSPDKNIAVSFLLNSYSDKPKVKKSDGGGNARGGVDEPMDVHVGVAARNYMQKILNRTRVPTMDFSAGTLWPGTDRGEIKIFSSIMEKAVTFVQGKSIFSDKMKQDRPNRHVVVNRQNMICDQGTVDILIRIIDKLTPISVRTDNTVAGVGGKGHTNVSEEEKAIMKMGRTILRKCLDLLFYTTVNNGRNQMYVGDSMPILLAHVGAQPLAARVVTDMLGSNMDLNEDKIGTREISIFTEKLRASKMNCMYLNLIRACCSCQGRGVAGNQVTVTEVVFKDFNDIIIQVHADASRPTKVSWKKGLYIPDKPEPSSPVMGQILMTKGLPALSLSWTTNSIDFSPLGLFGKLSVNVQELYGMATDAQGSGNSHANKAAVAEYFTSEMFLAADMCLDRNYVAIKRVEPLFTYEMLVSMVKMDVNESLKSAAVKLLLRLYVDRDPQVVSSVPCLTRTWSEISKNDEPQLPHVDISRQNQFALLQQLISDHVEGMRGRYWDGLSVHMMELMNRLTMFNFYGSTEKLKDVIEPIILALDRRAVEHMNNDSTNRTLRGSTIKRGKSSARLRGSARVGSELTLGEQGRVVDGVGELLNEEDEKEVSVPWQRTMLTFLESLPMIMFVVLLVIVALSVSISQEFTKQAGPNYTHFEYFVTAFFCVELTTRFYCYVYCQRVAMPFFKNVLNVIDCVVVAIDLVILGAPDVMGSGAQYTKALRAARLIRLVRVFRAARLVQKLKDLTVKKHDAWKLPARYGKVPAVELDTMVEAVNILSYVIRIIEDRNLSLLLRGFHDWECGQTSMTPVEILKQVMEDGAELSLGCDGFDDIFIDNLMLHNPVLTQSLLDVLMAHHSSTAMLLENAKNVQLLVSAKRERQYRNIDHFLLDLERYTETNDLWGDLRTDSDHRTNKAVRDIINDLIDFCRVKTKVLTFDQDYTPDKSIQDLLRNLGFFDICFKILRLMDDIDEIKRPIAAKNNLEIIKMCNELLYWFLLDNAQNQNLAFESLDFFLHSLDMKIGSHRVVQAIFSSNEGLMRSCPRSLIFEFTEKVCNIGKYPQYLSLLASITNVGDKNILENQYEIVKHMIAPSRLPKMVAFFCPITDPIYERKIALMEPFLSRKDDIGVDELPDELAYHMEFLRVLAGCTVGRINITTVEAKVQSVFDFKHIIDHILDSRCILAAKTRLALFLYNAVIEVEIMIPEIPTSRHIWSLLSTFPEIFEQGALQLQEIEDNTWENSGVRRQDIEYMMVGVMIVSGFFGICYDPSKIKMDDSAVAGGDVTSMSLNEVNELITRLYHGVKAIYDVHSSILDQEQKQVIVDAMDGLGKSVGRAVITSISNNLINSEGAKEDGSDNETELEPGQGNNEARITRKYSQFLEALESSEEVTDMFSKESKEFISKIEKLPFIADNVVAEVRYEPFIKKLVAHVRDKLEVVGEEKRLDARCTQTTTWMIRSFRTMIENRWGMSIYERDDDGGEEEDIAAAPVVNALNSCGATTLCLDLISVGIDAGLMLESVKLCVAMLFLEGGNLEVQETMYDYLSSTNSELFFRQMRVSITKLIAWHKWHDVIVLEEGEDPDLPDDVIIVRFLQLMCEGHYRPNQDILREQPKNDVSVNLLDDFVAYLNCVSRIPCRTSTVAGISVSATILEVIQGPCMANQEYFVLNTELIETINRLMRASSVRDCQMSEELELKKTGIDILQGLLEGQGSRKTVYERVLSVIHLDIIQMMCAPPPKKSKNDDDAPAPPEDEVDEETEEAMQLLRTESLVFLQMLCDYKPSLRNELEFVKDATDNMGSEVACVEILWRGELQRRFFHVPDICSDLAKSSKDTLVEEVDRSNIESKLQDFVFRSHELYREVKHQQVLKAYNVSGIFSRSNQNMATWISFFLALLINLILLMFYTAKSGTPMMRPEVVLVVDALNVFQLVFASFTLVLFLVVRVPVKYQHYEAAGYSTLMTIMYTATDALTVYYFVYTVICFLAINVSDICLTLLLLDVIVKNSTTRDVLYAVINPRKQLAMTLLLGIFITYIFSFFIFYNFRDELLDGPGKTDCKNLFDCFKMTVAYGIRSPNGTGDLMTHTVGTRSSVDILHFLVVMVVLLNVIFGIIIDTFGDLRSKKIERLRDTTDTCFICGIDKQIFDRASDTPNGFKTHIRFDHNMWNYLYFIIYVWEQDKDDDDGLEQYVRRSLDSNDLSWFPMNRAMRLASTVSPEEELRTHLTSDVESSDRQLMEKISIFQSDVSDSLDKILFYLKSDDATADKGLELPAGSASQDEFVPSLPATTSSGRQSKASTRNGMKKKNSIMSRGELSFLSVDDMGASIRDDSTTASTRYKQITIQLEGIIEGVKKLIPADVDTSRLFCRIKSATGTQDVSVESIRLGVFEMEKVEIIVSHRSDADDTNVCAVELHLVSTDGESTQVLGVAASTYSELISMSGDSAESSVKEFRVPGGNSSGVGTGAFLRFYITCAAPIEF